MVSGEADHADWVVGSQSDPGRCPRLAQALASAFQDDPVIAWIFPDEQRRRAVLPAFMEFRLPELAFPHDEVWMTAGGAAAAVWLPPPGRWQLSRAQRLRLLPPLVSSLGCGRPRCWVGLSAWRSGTRTIGPTGICSSWVPSRRRRDKGWARPAGPDAGPRGRRRDACLPGVLERANIALYGRHGFEITGEVAIPGGPRIWPMWREPELERVITEGSVRRAAASRCHQ